MRFAVCPLRFPGSQRANWSIDDFSMQVIGMHLNSRVYADLMTRASASTLASFAQADA